MSDLELDDIQGIIIRGYKHQPYSRYVFLQISDPQKAKQWLDKIADETTTAAPWPNKDSKPATSLNIAFTCQGLERLGLTEAINTFSREFQEGMDQKYRARILGDTGESDPDKWEFGGPSGDLKKDNIHILLLLYGKDRDSLNEMYDNQRDRINQTGGMKELFKEDSYINEDNREPFGFHDGISQPGIEGSGKPEQGQDYIKAGEFILGYLNEYNKWPFSPTVPKDRDPNNILRPTPTIPELKDLGRNGSYLICRKLSQDVDGFHDFLKANSKSHEDEIKLAAKFIGRWPSGTPLVLCPERDDPEVAADPNRLNNFRYAKEDPEGYKCPIGAHIRRANPRDSLDPGPEESITMVNRHRIIRRGRRYGTSEDPDADKNNKDKGILFIAINASIKRQFEFVQQTWINNSKFDASYDNKDPVAADPSLTTTMVIQQKPIRKQIHNIPRFVEVRGGGYFFLPGIRALRFLAQGG